MTKKDIAIKSSFIIIFFNLIGRLMGFAREMLVASTFGSNTATDAYFAAITATGLITALVTVALRTTTIPILSKAESVEGKAGKISHTNNLLNATIIISSVLVVVGTVFSPLIVKILAIGFVGEQYELAILLTRVGMPALLFKAIVGIYRGYLQSERMFFESAISDVSLNLVTILYLLFLSIPFGIKGLMLASVISVVSQFLIQIPSLKKSGYSYEWYLNVKDEYLVKMLHLVPPVLAAVLIDDLNKIVDKTLASTLVPGSISALNYATKFETIIISVFVMSILTVIFPEISKRFSENNIKQLSMICSRGFNMIVVITIPATMWLIVLARPIIEIAFQRGQFDEIATEMTSIALVFYSVGLLAVALRVHFNNIYFAMQDTKTPMKNGGLAVILNLALSVVLVQFMQHAGLALATSLSSLLATILLGYGLRKKVGSVVKRDNALVIMKSLIISVLITVIGYLLYYWFLGYLPGGTLSKLISLLSSFLISFFVYMFFLYMLKVNEVELVVSYLKKIIRRA